MRRLEDLEAKESDGAKPLAPEATRRETMDKRKATMI
jgi:hypothetical protein